MGERDLGKIAKTTGIFVAVGAAIDIPVMIGMVAVPGPGTVIGAAYFIGKLALVLWLSEEIDKYTEGEGVLKAAKEKVRSFATSRRKAG